MPESEGADTRLGRDLASACAAQLTSVPVIYGIYGIGTARIGRRWRQS